MAHIHQIGTEGISYVSVNPNVYYTYDETLPLEDQSIEHLYDGTIEEHPSLINSPDKFELLESDAPDNTNWLNYLVMGEE